MTDIKRAETSLPALPAGRQAAGRLCPYKI
jgi:hypothetical protein